MREASRSRGQESNGGNRATEAAGVESRSVRSATLMSNEKALGQTQAE